MNRTPDIEAGIHESDPVKRWNNHQSICRPRWSTAPKTNEEKAKRMTAHAKHVLRTKFTKAKLTNQPAEAANMAVQLMDEFDFDVHDLRKMSGSYQALYSSSIVIFKEKHGDYIYDISTPDKFALTFITVLKQRLADGWYFDEYEDTERDHNQKDMFHGDDVTPKQKAIDILALLVDNDHLQWTGLWAYNFLKEHDGCEYEEFELESFNKIDETILT